MPNGGLASLINPANRDDLIDMMKDGFCFGMNKLSYIIQVKIVQVSLKMTAQKFKSVEDIIKCRPIRKYTENDSLDYLGFILLDFPYYPAHFLNCPQYLTFQNQLGLPDHGMPVRATMMHRIRQHVADCESFDASYFL